MSKDIMRNFVVIWEEVSVDHPDSNKVTMYYVSWKDSDIQGYKLLYKCHGKTAHIDIDDNWSNENVLKLYQLLQGWKESRDSKVYICVPLRDHQYMNRIDFSLFQKAYSKPDNVEFILDSERVIVTGVER